MELRVQRNLGTGGPTRKLYLDFCLPGGRSACLTPAMFKGQLYLHVAIKAVTEGNEIESDRNGAIFNRLVRKTSEKVIFEQR